MGNKAKNTKAVYHAIVDFKETHDGNMGTLEQIQEILYHKYQIAITPQWIGKLIQDLIALGKLKKVDGHMCVVGGHWALEEDVPSAAEADDIA